VVYVVYNVQITRTQNEGWQGVHSDPLHYANNKLFVAADVCYFVGAVLYLLAAMRDCDCFFWLPTKGGVTEIEMEAGEAPAKAMTLAGPCEAPDLRLCD